MNTDFSLAQFGILRPERVQWIFPSEGEILDHIQSKGLKAFFRNSEVILNEKGVVRQYKRLSLDDFDKWLPFYEQLMHEKRFDIFANKAWYEEKSSSGAEIKGLFFYQNGELIGSGITSVSSDGHFTLHFKASKDIELTNKSNSSLGSLIDYYFISLSKKAGATQISSGRSRNAFGVINTLGYLDFKLRMGYIPSPALETEMVASVPLNSLQSVAFFGKKDEKLNLFLLAQTPAQTSFAPFDFHRFQDVPFKVLELPLL